MAEDQAEVLALDETASVPAGTFDGLLETEDTTPLEPGLVERKFYARGRGAWSARRPSSGGAERVELIGVRAP